MSETSCKGTDGFNEHDIILKSGGRSLIATLCSPKSNACKPTKAVITIHGWGGNRGGPHRMFVLLSRELARCGVPCLRFDLSGRGNSDGDSVSLDIMINDTINITQYLKEKLNISDVRLCGICSGGNVAIGAATHDSFPRIAMISTFSFSPATTHASKRKLSSCIRQYIHKALSAGTWIRLLQGKINFKGVAKALQDSAHENKNLRNLKDSSQDIMKNFSNYTGRCFFVYGGADPLAVEAEQHYKIFIDAHKINAEFAVINGANHNFMAEHLSNELIGRLTAFLSE